MRDVVAGNLWIGNALEVRDVKAVLGLGVTAVVDLAIEEVPLLYPRDIVYCRFPLLDGDGNTPAVIRAAIDTITSFVRGGVPTLVTCSNGMSRSPAIIAAALATVDGIPPEQALKRVAAVGPHDISTTLWAEVEEACRRETNR